MNHPHSVEQPRYVIYHRDGVVLVERVTELLQRVEELDVILGFVSRVCDLGVELLPSLTGVLGDYV